jgi:hypothetical protein
LPKATQRRKNLFGFGDSRARTRAQEQADRLDARAKISLARAEQAAKSREEAKTPDAKTYRYDGETITKRGDEYWLADGSAFESLATAKSVIRSLKKNPKRKSQYGQAALMSAVTGSPVALGAELLRNPKGKRNPEEQAAETFEMFHGVPSDEEIIVQESHHSHSNLAVMGILTEIKVKTVQGPKATLKFSHKGPEDTVYLCSNENRNQMFIEGGDQRLDLESLGFDGDWKKEFVLIGVMTLITYRTRKKFDKMRETDYYHRLGEDSGDKPSLVYDSVNEKLSIVGGKYDIRDVGICN